MKTTIEQIPEHMMPFFINEDVDCYTDEEISQAKEWMASSGVKEVIMPTEEDYQPYFCFRPAFGLACDVVDCECVLEW